MWEGVFTFLGCSESQMRRRECQKKDRKHTTHITPARDASGTMLIASYAAQHSWSWRVQLGCSSKRGKSSHRSNHEGWRHSRPPQTPRARFVVTVRDAQGSV